MAAPVIQSVTPAAATLAPGEHVDVVVVASDPDNAQGTVSFDVTDSQGNTTPANVELTIGDPLTFGEAADTGGLNVTVERVSVQETQATYRITAT